MTTSTMDLFDEINPSTFEQSCQFDDWLDKPCSSSQQQQQPSHSSNGIRRALSVPDVKPTGRQTKPTQHHRPALTNGHHSPPPMSSSEAKVSPHAPLLVATDGHQHKGPRRLNSSAESELSPSCSHQDESSRTTPPPSLPDGLLNSPPILTACTTSSEARRNPNSSLGHHDDVPSSSSTMMTGSSGTVSYTVVGSQHGLMVHPSASAPALSQAAAAAAEQEPNFDDHDCWPSIVEQPSDDEENCIIGGGGKPAGSSSQTSSGAGVTPHTSTVMSWVPSASSTCVSMVSSSQTTAASTTTATAVQPSLANLVAVPNLNQMVQVVNGQLVLQAQLKHIATPDGGTMTVAVLPTVKQVVGPDGNMVLQLSIPSTPTVASVSSNTQSASAAAPIVVSTPATAKPIIVPTTSTTASSTLSSPICIPPPNAAPTVKVATKSRSQRARVLKPRPQQQRRNNHQQQQQATGGLTKAPLTVKLDKASAEQVTQLTRRINELKATQPDSAEVRRLEQQREDLFKAAITGIQPEPLPTSSCSNVGREMMSPASSSTSSYSPLSTGQQLPPSDTASRLPSVNQQHAKPDVKPTIVRRKPTAAAVDRKAFATYRQSDADRVSHPDTRSAFGSIGDVCARLLPYHLYNEPDLAPHYLHSVDTHLCTEFARLSNGVQHLSDRLTAALLRDAQHDEPIEEQCLVAFLRSQTQRDALAADRHAAQLDTEHFVRTSDFEFVRAGAAELLGELEDRTSDESSEESEAEEAVVDPDHEMGQSDSSSRVSKTVVDGTGKDGQSEDVLDNDEEADEDSVEEEGESNQDTPVKPITPRSTPKAKSGKGARGGKGKGKGGRSKRKPAAAKPPKTPLEIEKAALLARKGLCLAEDLDRLGRLQHLAAKASTNSLDSTTTTADEEQSPWDEVLDIFATRRSLPEWPPSVPSSSADDTAAESSQEELTDIGSVPVAEPDPAEREAPVNTSSSQPASVSTSLEPVTADADTAVPPPGPAASAAGLSSSDDQRSSTASPELGAFKPQSVPSTTMTTVDGLGKSDRPIPPVTEPVLRQPIIVSPTKPPPMPVLPTASGQQATDACDMVPVFTPPSSPLQLDLSPPPRLDLEADNDAASPSASRSPSPTTSIGGADSPELGAAAVDVQPMEVDTKPAERAESPPPPRPPSAADSPPPAKKPKPSLKLKISLPTKLFSCAARMKKSASPASPFVPSKVEKSPPSPCPHVPDGIKSVALTCAAAAEVPTSKASELAPKLSSPVKTEVVSDNIFERFQFTTATPEKCQANTSADGDELPKLESYAAAANETMSPEQPPMLTDQTMAGLQSPPPHLAVNDDDAPHLLSPKAVRPLRIKIKLPIKSQATADRLLEAERQQALVADPPKCLANTTTTAVQPPPPAAVLPPPPPPQLQPQQPSAVPVATVLPRMKIKLKRNTDNTFRLNTTTQNSNGVPDSSYQPPRSTTVAEPLPTSGANGAGDTGGGQAQAAAPKVASLKIKLSRFSMSGSTNGESGKIAKKSSSSSSRKKDRREQRSRRKDEKSHHDAPPSANRQPLTTSSASSDSDNRPNGVRQPAPKKQSSLFSVDHLLKKTNCKL